jgi:CBS-domain-containing membrane protein
VGQGDAQVSLQICVIDHPRPIGSRFRNCVSSITRSRLKMIMSPPEVAAEAAQRRVVELEVRIAEQAAFILVLKRNGSAVLAMVRQDVLKDLRRSLQAARKEMR